MSMIRAKVIADSVAPTGKRITTLELVYPRFIHGEVMTHRMFSRNAASSRAIPVRRTIEQVLYNPMMPLYMGQEKKGMQAGENLKSDDWAYCYDTIMAMRIAAVTMAESLVSHNLHKSIVNRYLEPWQQMKMIVTATNWSNFFALRDHPDAEGHMRHLAQAMKEAIQQSMPAPIGIGQWHAPYVGSPAVGGQYEDWDHCKSLPPMLKMSVARCARVSYNNHDGTKPDVEKDYALHDMLLGSGHMSPFEHQATPLPSYYDVSGNFQGWEQYRKELANESQEDQSFKYDSPI